MHSPSDVIADVLVQAVRLQTLLPPAKDKTAISNPLEKYEQSHVESMLSADMSEIDNLRFALTGHAQPLWMTITTSMQAPPTDDTAATGAPNNVKAGFQHSAGRLVLNNNWGFVV